MTVLVGIVDGDRVIMGADRGMSERGYLGSIVNHKLKRLGPMVVGYSGSQGTGQLAHHCIYPYHSSIFRSDLETWLRVDFCDTIQKAADLFKVDINTDDNAADFLVGVSGRLFEITTRDWSVSEYKEIATGSGYQYALGSLFTSRGEDAHSRVKLAVKAAIAHSPECAKPIDVLTV